MGIVTRRTLKPTADSKMAHVVLKRDYKPMVKAHQSARIKTCKDLTSENNHRGEWVIQMNLRHTEEENKKDVFKVKEKGLGIDP